MDNTEFLLQEIEGLEKSLKEANDKIEALEKAESIINDSELIIAPFSVPAPIIPDHIKNAMTDIYKWMKTESYGAIQTDYTDNGILKMFIHLENVEPVKINLSEVLKDD